MSIQEYLERPRDDCFDRDQCVVEITSRFFDPLDSWKLAAAGPDLVTVVIFYVPWCHHCKELHDVFCKVARLATFASFVAFNCEKQCKHFGKISHDMPFLVKTFPTIIGYVGQVPVEEFKGTRTVDALVKFAGRLTVWDQIYSK